MDPDVPVSKPFPDEPMNTSGIYTGPFRAQVKKNDDREEEDSFLGRIRVWIPQVHGEDYKDRIDELPWAWPNFMGASKKEDLKAGFFGVPPEDSWVYVLFENGDPDHPIYLGGWYGGEKGDTEVDDYFQEDDRSSARYPNIMGFISQFGGKFRVRILDEDRFELVWMDGSTPQAIIEFDSVGYDPNTEPTVRIDTKWKVKVKSEKDIELESDETVKIKCKRFEVEAEEAIEMKSEKSSTYEAVETNTFKGENIKGRGLPDGGFDRYGIAVRRDS